VVSAANRDGLASRGQGSGSVGAGFKPALLASREGAKARRRTASLRTQRSNPEKRGASKKHWIASSLSLLAMTPIFFAFFAVK
jgi:hypothetical protein